LNEKNNEFNQIMKIVFVLFSFVALNGIVFSQNAQFDWAQNADNILGISLTSDALGNVYCAGFFKNTVDFDPGAGVFNLTSNGDLDIFVSKKDPSGNLIWARKIGGSQEDTPTSIKLDNSGNVLITGSFKGTCDFDPGSNSFNLTSAGDADIFICKLNPSGNFIWSKQIGGTGMDIGNSLATDQAGNIYASGYFRYTVDFDPGAGVTDFVSGGTVNSFILKLNESGDFIWAKQFSGSSSVYAYSLALDQFGNVYSTGWYYATVDFDPSASTYNLTSSGLSDVFVCKLDNLGNFMWAKTVGHAFGGDDAHSVVTDDAGNVYVGGFFNNTVDFDPNGGIFNLSTSGGSYDVDGFILKLSGGGDFIWAKQIAGTDQSTAESLDIDNSANLYITGYFFGVNDFDPGIGVYNLPGVGNRDVFIQKLDSSGNFVWAKQIGGSGYDQSFAIEVDVNRNIYTVGTFENTVDFNTETGVYNLNANGLPGSLNGFTHKLKNECLAPISSTIVSQTNVSCNGENNGSATVNASGGTGTLSYSWSPGGGNTNTATGLVAGTYTCTITDVNLCSSTQTITVTQPTAVNVSSLSQTNVNCNGESNGTASINAPTGGAGGYLYNWTPGNPAGDGTTSVTGLTAGTWTCTVTDANGCTGTQNFTITEPTTLSVSALSQTNVSCHGGNNGVATINTPTGGAGGYLYNWTPGNPAGDGTTSVTELTAGTWTCTVTDENGCSNAQNFLITQATEITSIIAAQNNVSCNGFNDGSVTINANGGTGTLNYSWSPYGGNSFTATALTAGTYICTITDVNDCEGSQVVTITEPLAIDITTSVLGITITSNLIGADYQWIDCSNMNQAIPGATAQTFTPTSNGNYAVVVSFGNSCADTSDCVAISTIGLNEKELDNIISVYPNPSQGIFVIESRSAMTATIIDVFGKVITNMELKEGSNQIDLSTHARGVYYIKLNLDSQNQIINRIIRN
jgi:hypothetical protein